MLRLEWHSSTTANEVVSVSIEWWIIFYRWFVCGWRQAVRYAPWAGANDAVMAGTVFSWAVVEIKRALFVLCTVIIGCVAAQMEPHLTPNPHTLRGRVGGYICNGIKWLDTLPPLRQFREEQNLVVFSFPPLWRLLLWKAFCVGVSAQHENVLVCTEESLAPIGCEDNSPTNRDIFQTSAHNGTKSDIFSNLFCSLIPSDHLSYRVQAAPRQTTLEHVGCSLVSNHVSQVDRDCAIYLKVWHASIFTTYWLIFSQPEYVSPCCKFQSWLPVKIKTSPGYISQFHVKHCCH